MTLPTNSPNTRPRSNGLARPASRPSCGTRSATHGGPIEAAWWALCTCVLRFAAPLLGVSEFFRGGDPVLLTAVYAVPAAIATGLVRWWELKPTASLNDFISSQERADAEKNTP